VRAVTYAGKVVSVRLCAHQVRIVADSQLIAQHAQRFGRDQLICDPWHYLPVQEKKPGTLRNGAQFQDWDLPQPIQVVRDRILEQPKGDRAFVELLLGSRDVGMEPLQVACELVLDAGVITAASPPAPLSLQQIRFCYKDSYLFEPVRSFLCEPYP